MLKLATLPLECTPRTYEFAFNTSHLSLYSEGAKRYSAQLDDEYDTGSVAFAFAFAGSYPAERAARAAGTPTCPPESHPVQAPGPTR